MPPSVSNFELRKKISAEEFDYTLLCSTLSQYTGVRQKIHSLLAAGVIVRVKKGLYVFGSNYNQVPVCKETLANLIYGPSYISLEYALAFYGLIPERVETITSVTPKRDKLFKTPLGQFTYKYLALEKYNLGIQQVWPITSDNRHPVLMATPEKALCDYILLHKVRNLENAQDAQSFLQFDMRIDRSNWEKLNAKALRKLNQIFQNKNIDWIQRSIA